MTCYIPLTLGTVSCLQVPRWKQSKTTESGKWWAGKFSGLYCAVGDWESVQTMSADTAFEMTSQLTLRTQPLFSVPFDHTENEANLSGGAPLLSTKEIDESLDTCTTWSKLHANRVFCQTKHFLLQRVGLHVRPIWCQLAFTLPTIEQDINMDTKVDRAVDNHLHQAVDAPKTVGVTVCSIPYWKHQFKKIYTISHVCATKHLPESVYSTKLTVRAVDTTIIGCIWPRVHWPWIPLHFWYAVTRRENTFLLNCS